MTTPSSALAALQAKTAVKEQPQSAMRAFRGPYHGYVSFLTKQGNPFTFFNGFIRTEDKEVIETLEGMKDVVEVEDNNIPEPPRRNQARNYKGDLHSDTVMSPIELLTRAVANSTHVPQAGESSSTDATK